MLGVAAALLWSINNVLAASALSKVGTTTATLVSMAASLALVVPLAIIFDWEGLVSISLVAVAWFAVLGFFNFPGGRYTTYAAIQRIGASRTVMIRNLSPILVVVLGIVIFAERPSLMVIVGGLFIVSGLYLVVQERRGQSPAGTQTSSSYSRRLLFAGYGFAALAAISYGLGSIVTRASVFTQGSPWVAGVISLLVGTMLISMIDARNFDFAILRKTKPLWLMIGAGVTSAAAMLLVYVAYGIGPVSVVAPFVNMQPIFTALIAHVALGGVDRLTKRLTLAVVVATVGAILIVAGV